MSSINLVSINQIDWSSPSLQRLLSSTSTLSKCLISIVISINLSIIVANETTTTTTATIRSIFDQSTGRIYLENGMEVINNNSQLPSNTFRTILLQSQPTTTSIPFNNNNDNKNVDNVDKSSKSQISVHIYLIFFIGFVPACVVGALAWCGMNDRLLQCCKNPQHQNKQCDYEYNNHHDHHRHYHSRHCHHIDHETNENFNHKHSNHHHHHGQSNNHHHRQQMIDYNNNNHRKTNEILQSRPIHSTYEVPRNSFEMLEILGEGNFGQVWKAKSYYFNNNHGHNHQQYNDYLNKKQQFVAVKTNKLNDNDEHQDDLLKELDIMVQLGSHPNVVRLLGCCTENKPYYIVMEYVSKGKLLSYLRKHRNDYLDIMNYNDINNGNNNNNNNSSSTLIMSNTNTNYDYNNNNRPSINNDNYMTYHNHRNNDGYGQINGTKSIINNGKIKNNFYENNNNQSILTSYDLIQFAYQICKGMEFISSHGIIHRDLAIRNILIDEHKNCKVADFGLSRSIRDKDCDLYEMKHGGQVPVRWMSPEALTMGIFSIKSDVWAFGITLWEIVTLGSTPYIGMNASEVINFIRQGNICPQPEHCNDHLYDLMKSCWAYKADDRFTFTQIKYQLMKMLLAMQENQNNNDNNYIDLDNFNNSLYYFNTTDPSDEKL